MKNHSELSRNRIEEFETLCRQQGLPLTVQRRIILAALLHRADHPAADQIFDVVKEQIPGVSRTTVYRVLETLVRLGLVEKTYHPSAMVRFDPNMQHHHHLVCTHCEKIVDIDEPVLQPLPLPDSRRTGFAITDYSVYFKGLCAECQQKGTEPRRTPRRRRRANPQKET
jgi:Fur family transcriptional regulator, peroxide stress response regulator